MLEKYKEGMSRPQQQRDWNNILTQGNEPMKRLNTESRAALKNKTSNELSELIKPNWTEQSESKML